MGTEMDKDIILENRIDLDNIDDLEKEIGRILTDNEVKSRDVFVSYHMDSSEEIVRTICSILEERGISCWYASRDSMDAYSVAIVRAIRGCKIFLLILNENSNQSEHVKNEIHIAFNHFCHHEEMTLLPFRIDDCELSEAVDYYLGRQRFMDGRMPPEMVRVQELTDRISELLGKKASRSGQVEWREINKVPYRKSYKIITSMMYPDNQFVGRKKELEQLHHILSGKENKAFLVGMGGIGKSEIAKMYCKEYRDMYDVIVWISFSDSLLETVTSDSLLPIEGLSRTDYASDDKRAYFERKMKVLKSIGDERVLFVVDNFDVTSDPDLEEFCSGSYGVLFTTRYQQEEKSIPFVLISAMEDENELMKLFQIEYTRNLDESGQNGIKEIIRLLSGHTLSVRLVASTMQKQRMKPEKMLEVLCQKENISGQGEKATRMIRERLHQLFNMAGLNEEEQYLMKNLALFPLRGISVEQFYEWCELEDYEVIDTLINRSWIVHDQATDRVHLHPLIGDLFAEEIGKEPDCCQTLLQHFIEINDDLLNVKQEVKNLLLDYVDSILYRLPQNHPCRVELRLIRGNRLFSLSYYYEALAYYQDIFKTETMDQEQTLFCLVKLSHINALLNHPNEAIAYALEGMELLKDIPYDSFEKSIGFKWRELLGRLGESYRLLGQYEEALKYQDLYMEYADMYYSGKVQVARGWSRYHCARTRIERGWPEDYELCEKMLLEGIEAFDEIDDEWSKSFTYDQLALIYARQGRFEEALALSQKAKEILIPLLGSEHLDIGNNLVFRGDIYKIKGDVEQANHCYQQAIHIYHKNKAVTKEEETRKLLQEA